jgi:signal transduction histidine kinase/ABC-type branched-subunit amino acid transport system ATPase component
MKASRLLLQMRNIHVTYEKVQALNGIDFDLYPGEIHALIGEHRAGKSSLVKILSGAVRKREGDIFFNGKRINFFTPRSATMHGIGMVYQNLNIIPNLNAVKNIFAGQMIINRWGFLDYDQMLRRTIELFRQLEFNIDPSLPLYRLTLWQQYMVEFARILVMNPSLIILDEVSNKLTPEEMKTLYRVMYEKRNEGKSIIYITHNIDEILQLADRVTILKNGYRRGTENVKDLDQFRLFQLTYSFAINKQEPGKEEKRFWIIKRYVENIIQHLPVGVIVFDAKDKVQIVNYAALELLKTDHESILKKAASELLAGIKIDIGAEIAEKIQDRAEASWDEVKMPEEALTKISVIPFKDRDYRFLGTTMIIQDVSIDHYLQSYFVRSEKMASVAELAVGVAHEINNPLYIVKNYFELIRDDTLDRSARRRIDEIEKEVDRIVEIVSSLLSFSRIRDFPAKRVNLVYVLEEVLLLLHHTLSKKNIILKKNLPAQQVEIFGDENKLKQLFINLINNSIEAVLDEGVIGVDLLRNNGEKKTEVVVSDNGYGIPRDIQDSIFKPFYSTKINKRNTGLGLSICQHIVREHGGEISFSSLPGEKTSFRVQFSLPDP